MKNTALSTQRRTGCISAVILAALVGVGFAPAPAQAAGSVTEPKLLGRTATYQYQGNCTVSVPNTANDVTLPTTGVATPHSIDNTATITDGVRTTHVSQHAEGKAALSLRNGQLSTLGMVAKGNVAADLPAGDTCGTSSWVSLESKLKFSVAKPQWVTVKITTDKQTSAWFQSYDDAGEFDIDIESYAAGGTNTGTWYLPAGTYTLGTGVHWDVAAQAGDVDRTRAGSGSVHVELRDLGSAYAAASGSGKTYVTLPGTVDCSKLVLPVAFTSAGFRVKSASFSVNGTTTRYLRNPSSYQHNTVPGISRYGRSTVKARLVVDPAGSASTATVTVSRTYRACDAR